jgi:hypothetical protein
MLAMVPSVSAMVGEDKIVCVVAAWREVILPGV